MEATFLFLSGLVAFVVILLGQRGIRKRINRILEHQVEIATELKRQREVRPQTAPAPRSPAPVAEAPQPTKSAAPLPAVSAVPPPLRQPAAPAKPATPPMPVLAPKPAEPTAASRMAESAKEALVKIWNWILWNQESRPTGVSIEYAVATTWLVRLCILAVAFFVIYLLRWSIQQGLLVPPARVAVGILVGVGMLVSGLRLLRSKYHLIGQGFLGGGLLILYFSVYAAGPMYHVIPSISGVFGLMILVTVAAGFLAVRTNSLLVAVIALAGGYMTPVMIHTPTPQLAPFYAYVLLLTLAVLGVAARRQWRLLNYLSFIFTYALFGGSLDVYKPQQDFMLVIGFLAAYFVLHSSMVYIHNIIKGAKSTTLEVIHLVANAGLCAGFGYHLVFERFGRPYPALLSLALALFFMAHVGIFLWRRQSDRPLLICLLALAGGFTIWTLPLVLEKESLTICFSLLAFMFLWMGRKAGSAFLENLGVGLYLFVFARLMLLDLPGGYGLWRGEQHDPALYWKHMLDRLGTFGISIGSVAAAFFLQRKDVRRNDRIAVPAGADMPVVLPRGMAANAFFWFGSLFVFLFFLLEFNRMFCVQWQPMRMPMLTAVWCAMAAFYLWDYLSAPARVSTFVAFCVLALGAALKPFLYDVYTWKPDHLLVYREVYAPVFVLARFLDFGAPFLFLLVAWRLLRPRADGRVMAPIFGYTGLALLFCYVSLELNSLLYWKLSEFRLGGISVLWALFGISFIVGGIWKNVRPLRYVGLLLIAIVVGKIFLVDLSGMPSLYRVIAFLVLGLLLLLGSFAYIYSNRKFTKQENEGIAP
jgi:hypothetical protein